MDSSVKIIRVFFILACIIMGALWGQYVHSLYEDAAFAAKQLEQGMNSVQDPKPLMLWVVGGGLIGGGISIGIFLLMALLSQNLYERLAPAIISIVLGLVVGYFLGQYILWWFPNSTVTLRIFVVASLVLVFGFVGIVVGLTRASNWESLITAVQTNRGNEPAHKLVDTSAIIDGRIKDICDSGFIDGTLMVPRFVLHELQHIADSADVLRRAKGRRGLDILKSMQDGESKVIVEIIDDDPVEIREVDSKLVKLAQKFRAKVLTNDYNLNKVAQIEGVEVLNINDLANALKPAVLPDEAMKVKVIKEGKEPNQGIGYLDDGTMIVVDGGRAYMGQDVGVIVTSVLQTAAGRMIFTRFDSALT